MCRIRQCIETECVVLEYTLSLYIVLDNVETECVVLDSV